MIERGTTSLAAALLWAATLLAPAARRLVAPSPDAIPGLSYTMTVTTTPHGAAPAPAPAPASSGAQKVIARVTEAAGRGRIDVLEGTFGAGFGKGDYMLFDSTEFVIVRPGSKEFTPVPGGLETKSIEMLQSLPGVQLTVANVKVSLDTIRRVDTIEGLPTRHYRLAIAYDIALDAGVMKETIGTSVQSDFWMADLPGFPPTPFSQVTAGTGGGGASGGAGGSGALKELVAKVNSATAALHRGVPLKSVSLSRMTEGAGPPTEMEQTNVVSDYMPAMVDASRLMLPSGYTAAPMPGMENFPGATVSDDAGAKWRVRPGKTP